MRPYPTVQIDDTDSWYWVVRFTRPGAWPLHYWLEVPLVLLTGRTQGEAADVVTRLFLKHAPSNWQPREWVTTWLLVREAIGRKAQVPRPYQE